MKFNFPKPLLKKTVWVELENDQWDLIQEIQGLLNITQEQVLNTVLSEALEECRAHLHIAKLTQKQKKDRAIKKIDEEIKKEDSKLSYGIRKTIVKPAPVLRSEKIDPPVIPSQLPSECRKCGMKLIGELNDRRSKIVMNLCDGCDGSEAKAESESSYQSPSAGIGNLV